MWCSPTCACPTSADSRSSTCCTSAHRVDVILMTAFDDMPTVVSAMRGGAVEFLVKPVNLSKLRQVMTRVFQGPAPAKARRDERRTDAPQATFSSDATHA